MFASSVWADRVATRRSWCRSAIGICAALVESTFAWRRATGERETCWRKRGVSLVSRWFVVSRVPRKSFLQEWPTRVPQECPVSVLLKSFTRVSCKSDPQECPTRVSHKSVPQEFPTRVSHKECRTRVSCKSDPQECPTRVSRKRVSHKSDPQECPTRVSHESVLQECPTRVSYKSVPQECPTRVSCKSVPQECPTKV